MRRPDIGDPWLDNALPVGLAFLCALAHVLDGGGAWTLMAVPVGGWAVW